jgi:hypothetical protein
MKSLMKSQIQDMMLSSPFLPRGGVMNPQFRLNEFVQLFAMEHQDCQEHHDKPGVNQVSPGLFTQTRDASQDLSGQS